MNFSRTFFAAVIIAAMFSCKPSDETRVKAIIGAVLIDPSGAPPISRSVLVIAGTRVRAVGEQATTPVPAGSEKVNGAGKFLVPAPVVIPDSLPRIRTLADARTQIDGGAIALAGMVLDTEDFDEFLTAKWRDLRVVFVPRLSEMESAPADLARAQRNIRLLATRGVLIGAGDGPRAVREYQLLAAAGLSAQEVLAAATTNAARAVKQGAELGALGVGMTASAWLLNANPLEDAGNLAISKTERILAAGQWVK